MQTGDPSLKSIGPLAFGPEGILFVADAKSAAIIAIATGDTRSSSSSSPVKVEKIDMKIAGLLGTTADQIQINDMVVNPVSHSVYLAVTRGNGPDAIPVLLKVDAAGTLALVDLDNIKHSRAQLSDAPVDAEVGEGRRRSNPRMEAITDIAFHDGHVIVAGLSNQEFASSLRTIEFPFNDVENGAMIEIYHGAHGQFETRSPVRTFVPFNVGNEPQLLAAYTCTPLVQFPISDLKPNAKVKGKTIAELGNRNRPLDMIVYQKDGQHYILMANSARGIMKINAGQIAGSQSIEERVDGTKGVAYETVEAWTGVNQLDQLDGDQAVVVQQIEGGDMQLVSLQLP
jgi:hypothetical protein